MPYYRFFITGLCAVVLCGYLSVVAVVAYAAAILDPERAGAVEQAKAEARTLLDQRKRQDAYTLYIRLLRAEPDDDEINLGLARAATLNNRPNQAVMAYERLLEKYPHEGLLHRELAHAYTMLGADDLAAQHMALSDSSPEEAGEILARWSKGYDRWQVHGRVRAGLMHDTNANLGPASNTISLGEWNNVRLSNAAAQPTMAAYLGAQLDVGWRFDQVSPWWLVGEAQFYTRGNGNQELIKINARHSEWGRASGGIRHVGEQHMLDLRLKAEVFDYNFRQNITAAGPELTFLYAIHPQVHLISRAGTDRRTYLLDETRNGWYSYAGQYVRVFLGESQHNITVGARYIGGNAKWGNTSYDGWEATASVIIKLPHKIELAPFVGYTREWYGGPATMLETDKRQDNRWRAGVGLTIPIKHGWSVEAAYQYTQNHSTSELFRYQQHLTTLGVAWSF